MADASRSKEWEAVASLIRAAKAALEQLPAGRERSIVQTKLDEAELWFGWVKG